jgi:hypothetical protein
MWLRMHTRKGDVPNAVCVHTRLGGVLHVGGGLQVRSMDGLAYWDTARAEGLGLCATGDFHWMHGRVLQVLCSATCLSVQASTGLGFN